MIRFPLKIKFGIKALFRSPLRAIVAFLAAVAAFGIAGLCIFTQCYDMLKWERLNFLNDEDPYINVVIHQGLNCTNNFAVSSYKNGTTYEHYSDIKTRLNAIGGGYATMYFSDISDRSFCLYKLWQYLGDQGTNAYFYHDYNGEQLVAPYAYADFVQGTYDPLVNEEITTLANDLTSNFFSAITVYSGEDALQEFGYELVGKLPEQKDEVAIPQWLYNSFLCYGYRNPQTGETTEIHSEADIIGKTLCLTADSDGTRYPPDWVAAPPVQIDAKIVGVIHSDYQDELAMQEVFQRFKTFNRVGLPLIYSIPPHIGIAVSEEAFIDYRLPPVIDESNPYAHLYAKSFFGGFALSRKSPHVEEYFDYLTEWKKGKSYMKIWNTAVGSEEEVPEQLVYYAMSEETGALYSSAYEIFESTTIYFQIVPYLTVFALVYLAYFAYSTVWGKRHDMATLRSIGASKFILWASLVIPLLIFALLCSFAALGVEFGFLHMMNGKLNAFRTRASLTYYVPFPLSWQAWIFTLLAPAAVVAITSAIAVSVLTKSAVASSLSRNQSRSLKRNQNHEN